MTVLLFINKVKIMSYLYKDIFFIDFLKIFKLAKILAAFIILILLFLCLQVLLRISALFVVEYL